MERSEIHAKIFFKLLQAAEKELYPGCTDATKVFFIVELFQVKCLYGISNRALEGVLNLFSRFLPKGHCVPNTMEKVQRVVRDLGLDYGKIDACEKDCVLFWKKTQIWIHVPNVVSLGGKRPTTVLMISGAMWMVVLIQQIRSVSHVKSYGTFLLLLGYKDYI